MFQKIKENQPRAWELFEEWQSGQYNIPLSFLDRIYVESVSGILTKFLDEQGIIVDVSFWGKNEFESYRDSFYFDIYDKNTGEPLSGSYEFVFNSRTEAETKAFLKAFEILESRL